MLRIQSDLPPNITLDFVNEARVDTVLVMWRRAPGGITSFRAEIRSTRDSPSTSMSSSLEISDSRRVGYVSWDRRLA